MKIGKYLTAEKLPTVKGRKTCRWIIHAVRGDHVGEIRWYPKWRQYCFVPMSYTIFSSGCLADIQRFIDENKHTRAVPA